MNQKGFSIIELLIALTLGLIILASLIQVLLTTRQTSRLHSAFSQVQENGRVVMEYLAREIRATGYWGCAPSIASFTNHLDTSHSDYDPSLHDFTFATGISGTDNDGFNGSDSITLSGLFGDSLPVIQAMPNTSAVVKVPPNNNLLFAGDVVFISNCKGGDIFQITAGNPQSTGVVGHNSGGSVRPGNAGSICNTTGSSACPNCFCQNYGLEATIHTGFNSSRYFIDNSSDGPTLFVDDFYSPPIALAIGIENMQITYGVDTSGDGSANRYLEAGHSALDMQEVVSVKVNLLVRSSDDVLAAPQTHRFNWEQRLAVNPLANIETTATDRRLRRSYTMTVSIRNRIN